MSCTDTTQKSTPIPDTTAINMPDTTAINMPEINMPDALQSLRAAMQDEHIKVADPYISTFNYVEVTLGVRGTRPFRELFGRLLNFELNSVDRAFAPYGAHIPSPPPLPKGLFAGPLLLACMSATYGHGPHDDSKIVTFRLTPASTRVIRTIENEDMEGEWLPCDLKIFQGADQRSPSAAFILWLAGQYTISKRGDERGVFRGKPFLKGFGGLAA